MQLLRYQVFLTYAIAFLAVWYCAYTRLLPHRGDDDWGEQPPPQPTPWWWWAVALAPAWAVAALAAWLLARLILGVLSYRDCPEAAQELERQIEEARAEMKRRKIIE